MSNRNQPRLAIWMPLIIAICIAIGIIIGNVYKNTDRSNLLNLFPEANTRSNKIDFLLNYLDKYYVDSISTNQLVEDAIPGILSDLDPHSVYITREEMLSRGTELDGYFGGIGVEFLILDDTINIVNINTDGPSDKIGLSSGDKIVSVDDSIFAGIKLTNNQVIKKLRGAVGSTVKLGVKKNDSEEIIYFDIKRKEVPVKSIEAFYVLDSIGYIKIGSFSATTHDEFLDALSILRTKGAKSYIIDLRNNSGGSLNTAYKLTNEFLNLGELILYTEGRTQKRENFVADGKGRVKNEDLVILINENSASASEILAGAVQDLDRGLVIGRRSFGKGLVQNQFSFPDKSAMRITIARYHTPSGRCTQKPYEIGDSKEYDLEMMHRYESGELYNEDSLKIDYQKLPEFKTRKGRTIYGNSGIMPDVFIPQDTIGWSLFFEKVSYSGMLRSFSYVYANEHRTELTNMTADSALVHLEESNLMPLFLQYIKEHKEIKPSAKDLKTSESLIQKYLNAMILRNIFFDENVFYSIIQSDDNVINEASKLIKESKATPEAIGEELYLLNKKTNENK